VGCHGQGLQAEVIGPKLQSGAPASCRGFFFRLDSCYSVSCCYIAACLAFADSASFRPSDWASAHGHLDPAKLETQMRFLSDELRNVFSRLGVQVQEAKTEQEARKLCQAIRRDCWILHQPHEPEDQ
jgi:hypothetical protein